MLTAVSPLVRRRRGPARWWSRLVRWSRRRPAIVAGWGVLALLAVVVLWCGLTAWMTAQDLEEVDARARLLRTEIVDGDAAGAARALEDYQEAAESAEARTDGPTWWLVGQLPVVGDDAAAVGTVSAVLADLGRDGLPPLVDAAEQVAARAFNPTDHRFPLGAIASTTEPARQSERAFADAAAALRDVDSTGFVAPVRSRFDDLRTQVLTARSSLDSAYRAAELMPELLGGNRPRRYLLVLQNNAELRSLGGLTGSVSLIEADAGRVDIVAQHGTSEFGYVERPVLPLTRDERDLFGDRLGQWFMNASLTPDAPRAAELMAARWEREGGGRVDGVFFVDPVAVSYLLSATGPVDVAGYEPVDERTVVPAVENAIYLETGDREEQEDFQNAVAKAVFDAFAGGDGDPAAVIRNLVRGVAEGRVRMHSFVPEVQRQIAGTEIAGELPTGRDDAEVGVYLNDAVESKMSFYLRYDVDAVVRSCTGDVQDVAGTVALTNDVPDGRLPPAVTGIWPGSRYYGEIDPGQQRIVMYLMAPAGGTIETLQFDGRELGEPVTTMFRRRQVAPVEVLLDPGESRTLQFELRTGHGQTEGVDVFVTPGAASGTESQRLRTAC